MQATLEIQSGPLTGKLIVVPHGQVVKVGRVREATFAVPDDTLMSNLHFLVECDETSCRVRDLNSRFGTSVNGQKVSETVLSNDDLIVAGQTYFRVRLLVTATTPSRTAAPPPAPRAEPAPVSPARVREEAWLGPLLRLLRQEGALFALLDAARDPRVLELLRQSGEVHQSLYEGKQGEELADFAPYLAQLPAGAPFLETLAREGWGNSWGVYLACPQPFAEIRKHFRRFLLVKSEQGKELYFRFYDPRVLRVFLPTCNTSEIRDFFGSIRGFLMEDRQADRLLRFSAGGTQGVEQTSVQLSAAEAVRER